ncbi:hypothetical protein Dda_3477 [Drechslerella dactyloides]|uniref:Short chain dehydrogenase/reductase n=1 Tax=Drechslerella dactyloides TaxID=74499 RepID=A0AAD6J3Q1_DREDA|nr:hypothetical protein Dda_3477 [Drechslerella dactyloides]
MSVFKPGNVALISGGASGIGRAIANLCLAESMHVAIVDNNAAAIKDFIAEAHKKYPDAKIEGYPEDVANPNSWSLFKKDFLKIYQHLDLLVLNAAVWQPSDWEHASTFMKSFEVNVMGYLHGVSTFFKEITASKPDAPKAVVMTGSKQGITNPPGNPGYNASKAAVKFLAESLHYDLRNNPSTSVHLLVPGWTHTGMSKSKAKPEGAWHADQVAEYMREKMDSGDFYIICPDGEVDEETDKKRMLWGARDVVERRPPLSRWREDWKEKAAAEINGA